MQEIDTKSMSIIEKKRPELLTETATERAERMSRQVVIVWLHLIAAAATTYSGMHAYHIHSFDNYYHYQCNYYNHDGHVCILPNTRIHFGSRYNIGLLFSLQEAMRLEERREKMSAEIYGNISFAPRIDALSKVLGKATGT